jgi:hypothetical protein
MRVTALLLGLLLSVMASYSSQVAQAERDVNCKIGYHWDEDQQRCVKDQ